MHVHGWAASISSSSRYYNYVLHTESNISALDFVYDRTLSAFILITYLDLFTKNQSISKVKYVLYYDDA